MTLREPPCDSAGLRALHVQAYDAITESVDGSHVAFIANPNVAAEQILDAVAAI